MRTVRGWLALGMVGLMLGGVGPGCRGEEPAAGVQNPSPAAVGNVQRPTERTGTAGTVSTIAAPGQPAGETPAGLELRLHLGDDAGAEVDAVSRGEPVTLRLVLHNRGTTSRQIQCPSARTHDVRILAPGGRELWRWSRGRMFAQMLTDIAVGPGEAREFRVTWDQRTSEGAAVPPGRYEAEGSIPALGGEIHSPPLPFTIR